MKESSSQNAPMNETTERQFRWGVLLRLCTFHIGSAMGDILVTSVWNRVMIVNFGFDALPVGLLIALRYLLSPMGLYAGFRSDVTPLFGLRRTWYVWLGRGLMVLSFPLLALSVNVFANDRSNPAGWLIALLSFLFYGTGTLFSGSPFLALVRDAMPKPRQGLALSVVESALIVFFPLSAIALSFAMPEFSPEAFWHLALGVMLIGGFFWFFAIAGVEQPNPVRPAVTERARERAATFRATFSRIWADKRPRTFMLFLALATVSAWTQDAILEPFGAEVLNQSIAQTTRYAAYWQGATALVLIACAILFRHRRPEQQTRTSQIGLAVMSLGMMLLTATSLYANSALVIPSLVVFGFGFGIYTFGGFNLLVVMTTDRDAGIYLGLWTVTILLSRGIGITLGGALRDGLVAATASAPLAYAIIFCIEALGLAASIFVLARVGILSFARDSGRLRSAEIQVASADL